jgi:hypothetical protein
LEKVDYPVLFSRSFNAKPADLIRAAKELQFEGITAKLKGSCYVPGRRTSGLGQVQGEPTPGVHDWGLYGGRSLRAADRWLLSRRQTELCGQSQERLRPFMFAARFSST